jgi:predicted DNA-binding transcriptional regulator AlpA
MQNLVAANDNQPRRSVLPPSLAPRGVCREVAAEYLGISPSSFDLGVKDGTFPSPRRYRGRVIWDRLELDRAFDELPGNIAVNPWDKALAS